MSVSVSSDAPRPAARIAASVWRSSAASRSICGRSTSPPFAIVSASASNSRRRLSHAISNGASGLSRPPAWMAAFTVFRSRPIRPAIASPVYPSNQKRRISRASRSLTCNRFPGVIMGRSIARTRLRSDTIGPFPAPKRPEQVPPLPESQTFPALFGAQPPIIAIQQ